MRSYDGDIVIYMVSTNIGKSLNTPCRYRDMSNINAAIGLAQIKKLDGFIEKRRAVAKQYNELLSDVRGIILPVCNFMEMASFMYVIKVPNYRDMRK